MSLDRHNAADRTWRDKTEENASLIGAIVLLILISIPLIVL